jgi:hypothetical protein
MHRQVLRELIIADYIEQAYRADPWRELLTPAAVFALVVVAERSCADRFR